MKGFFIQDAEVDRKDWLEKRRNGLGGSDAAAILGLDPFRSAMSVWISKCRPELLEPEYAQWLSIGTKIEPVIDSLYQEATQTITVKPEDIIRHPLYPEIAGTPDRLSIDKVVELKNETQYMDRYGDFGTDAVPDHVLAQVAVYMSITGKNSADVAVLHAGSRFGVYTIRRDMQLEKEIIDRLRSWWADYVLTKREPPIDASEDWAQYIEKLHPKQTSMMLTLSSVSDSNIVNDVLNLKAVRHSIELQQEYEGRYENKIKAFIGENEGIQGDFGSITWRKAKDQKQDVTNYPAVIEEFKYAFRTAGLDSAMSEQIVKNMDGIIEAHTQRDVIVRKGSRRFVPKFK